MRRLNHHPRAFVAIVLLATMSWLVSTFLPNGAIGGVLALNSSSLSQGASAVAELSTIASATPTAMTANSAPVRHAGGAVSLSTVAPANRVASPQFVPQPPSHPGAMPANLTPQPVAEHHTDAPPANPKPAPQPGGHPVAAPPACTGYGDGAFDRNGISVDVWAPGIRVACGYPGYENGDNPMPPGTPFPPPRPFRSIDPTEPVFGFKVFYLNAGSSTPCNQLRIIFHQGDGPGGRGVRYHSMQYSIAHCDSNGNYLGYTDVAGFTDTGGVMDANAALPGGDNGTRPAKLAPSLADVQSYLVFEVWYVEFRISAPGGGNNSAVIARPGFDIHNVSAYYTPGDFTTVNYTCSVLGGGVPGDRSCQYDGAKRGIEHPDVTINNMGGVTDFCTDLYGNNPSTTCDATTPVHQHVFNGAPLSRQTCYADSGGSPTGNGDTPPNCYPEFVLGPNSPGGNKSSTPYESPGPATYAAPGLAYPD